MNNDGGMFIAALVVLIALAFLFGGALGIATGAFFW